MKKSVVLLIFLICAFFAAPASAGDVKMSDNNNLAQAGKIEFVNEEAKLRDIKDRIDKHIDSLIHPGDGAKDYVPSTITVNRKWMAELSRLIKEFDYAKNKADRNLKFYGLKTEINIPPEIRRITEIYFNGSKTVDGDNKKQEVRKYLTEKAGVPIAVENSVSVTGWLLVAYLSVIIFSVAFFLLRSVFRYSRSF